MPYGGSVLSVFVVVPAVIVGWFFGWQAGGLSGPAMIVAFWLLYVQLDHDPGPIAFYFAGGVLTSSLGMLVGWLSDLVLDRDQAQNALADLNEQLEVQVASRTAALLQTNDQLRTEIAEREGVQQDISRLAAVVDQAKVSVAITDLDGAIVYVNPTFEKTTGYTADEVLGENPRILKSGEQEPEVYEDMWRTLMAGHNWRGRLINQRKNGELYHKDTSIFPVKDVDGTVINYADVSTDVTDRVRDQAVLQHTANRLAALREIYQAILEAHSPEEIAQAALQHIRNLLNCVRASVVEFDFVLEEANLLAVLEGETKAFLTGERVPLAIYGVSQELEHGSIHFVEDTHKVKDSSKLDQELEKQGVRSYVSIPMIEQGVLIGALNLASNTANAYSPADIEVAREVANSLAVAIQSTRLWEETKQQAHYLRGLYETSLMTSSVLETKELLPKVCAQVKDLMHPDAFLVGQYCDNSDQMEMVYSMEQGKPIPELQNLRIEMEDAGLMGWMIRTGQSLLIRDFGKETTPVEAVSGGVDVCSWLGVPLIVGDKVIGAMSVQGIMPNAFTEAHLQLLESLAAQVAIGMENARLFEEANAHAQELARTNSFITALSHLAARIRTSPDPVGILKTLGHELKELGITFGMFLHDPGEKSFELQFLSVDNNVLKLAENLAGLTMKGFRIRQGLLPIYDDLLRYRRAQFSSDRMTELSTMLPNVPKALSERILQMVGVTAEARAIDAPLLVNDRMLGVITMWGEDLREEDITPVSLFANQLAVALENAKLLTDLRDSNLNLTLAYDTTLEGWAHALELRDMETEGHSRRVTELTMRLAAIAGISDEDLIHVRRGALLHDIGKIGIPDEILQKKGSLSEEEWDIMRQHPLYAVELLSDISYLHPSMEIPTHHHEKWDGSGYPHGLQGEQIPLAARVFAIVDVWDALTSDRPYRKAWSREKALDYIVEQSGQHFDPEIVDMFMQLMGEGARLSKAVKQIDKVIIEN